MHKVVVERPRHGRSWATSKAPPKPPFEDSPRYESMKANHTRRKWFSDLLGPLRRWLQSQVGRSWNDVYSEACAVIKPDSIIRAHVKTHLLEFVERNTFIHAGKVCILDTSYRGGVKPVSEISWRRSLFFVHPETTLLQPIPQMSKRAWRAREPKPAATRHWVKRNVALQEIRGLWFECHFEVVPVGVRFRAYDHALERMVTRSELTRHDKEYYLCTLKRQLSKRELRRFGLRNKPTLNSLAAQSSIGCTRRRLTTALQVSAGRRSWVIGHCRLAVQIRLRVSTRVAQFAERQCYPDRSLPARILMGRSCGLSPVIGSSPICSTRRGSSSMVEQPPQGVFHGVPCPSAISSRRVPRSTATHNIGGRMANTINDSQDSNFEITSKRRKGFPSETQVKRGVRVVHGNKELFEKLGRNDLCPCGSGRSF